MPVIIPSHAQAAATRAAEPSGFELGAVTISPSQRQREELVAESARFRRLPFAIVGLSGGATLALGAYFLLYAVARSGAPPSPVPIALAVLIYAITGIAYVLYRFGTAPITEGTFEITPSGLRVAAAGRSGTIPWKLIARVIDTGSAFMVVRYLTSPPIVLPKSALPEGGAPWWEAFRSALTGPRMLVASTPASNTIVNTRAPEGNPEH